VAAGYTPALREQLVSRQQGFDHTVFRTASGDLAESTTLSMLVVRDGRILAPPLDVVLDGITRRLVLDVADAARIPVEVRPVSWDEVEMADELVLGSSTHPVVPVGRLDQQHLDAPGPVTETLTSGVADLLGGRHPLSDHWLTPLD
jgi:branched-chain amino acid aminotransferase